MGNKSHSWIDGSLYPDVDPPSEVCSLADRIDFLARLCSAWDFGILPRSETIAEVRRAEWREAVDECRLLTSPTYHLLREWHGLDHLPYLGQQLPYIRDDPNLEYV
jgi:chromosome condensin MukBEF complex kleisin-like MukF subunit